MKTINISKEPNENKVNIFTNGLKTDSFTPEEMANAFSWNGDEVIKFMIEVLTDCNYHTEVKKIREILNIEL